MTDQTPPTVTRYLIQLLWREQWTEIGPDAETEAAGRALLAEWQERWPDQAVRLVKRTITEEVVGEAAGG